MNQTSATMPGPRAYSYIRMSTEMQATRGESLRRQLAASKKYALEKGLDLQEHESLHDSGVSAFKGDNFAVGRLGQFVRAAEDGKIEKGSFLLVESLDRISRENVYKAFNLFTRIIEADIVLVTLADGIVYSKASVAGPEGLGQLMISLTVMSRAHEESLMKSRRLSATWEHKRTLADSVKLTAMVPAWLRLSEDRKVIHVIPERASLLQQMFENSRDGIGTITIVRRLNQRGVPAWGRSKTGWQLSYVKKILDNRAVLGEYQPNKVAKGRREPLEPKPNYYPRVVPDDLFFAAQAARKARRNHGGRRGDTFSNLFTTLLRCGLCGASVRYINKGQKPKGGQYLRCSAAHAGHQCAASHWPYGHFETNFLAVVRDVDIGRLVADEPTKQRLTDLLQRQSALAAMAVDEETKLNNLTESLESELTDSARSYVAARINERVERLANYKAESKRLLDEIQQQTALVTSAVDRHRQLKELMSMMTDATGDAIYKLRARLAQHLRDSIDAIQLWPEGKPFDSSGLQDLAEKLTEEGFDPARIDAYQAQSALAHERPKEEKRYYFVKFRNGAYRYVQPDPIHSDLYTMTASTADGLRYREDDGDIAPVVSRLNDLPANSSS